jgi:hypothetical protein
MYLYQHNQKSALTLSLTGCKTLFVDFWHHWGEYRLVSNAEVDLKFNVESFYLTESVSNLSSLRSPGWIITAYGVSLILSWMPFSSGRFTRDLSIDTNPSLIYSWIPFPSGRFARGLCMDTSLKHLRIFFSQVPLFVWVSSLSTSTNPHFFNKLGGSGVLLFWRGLWNLLICRAWKGDWTVGVCAGHRLRT